METPCYVIREDGFRSHVSYQDDWCHGRSQYLGRASGDENPRDLIKDHIRQAPTERNGIPLYLESDHGNVSRGRRVTLRRIGR